MKTLIIGIGSAIRTDDGVGVHAARRLMERPRPDGVDVAELGTAGLALLDVVEGYDRLIVLDAMVTGAPPGTVAVLDGGSVEGTAHLGGAHETDLPTTLAVGRRVLGRKMPVELVVIAVEAADLSTFSEALTAEVAAAVPAVMVAAESFYGAPPTEGSCTRSPWSNT